MDLRRMVLRCADRLGLYHLLRGRRRGAIVLGYHGVEERIEDERIQAVHLPLRTFEQHVEHIRRNFEVLTLDALAERLREKRGLDGRQVVLTFDDGYCNNLHTVAPLLQSHELPFAVFVCPDRLTRGRRFTTYILRAGVYLSEKSRLRVPDLGIEFRLDADTDRHRAVAELSRRLKAAPQAEVDRIEEQLLGLHSPQRWEEIDERFSSDALMDWSQLHALRDQGVELGSHSSTHCILHEAQDPRRVHAEVHQSRERLIREFGECDYFAYPNGRCEDIGARAVAEVDAASYRLGFTLEFGETRYDSPRTLLPRIDGGADIDILKLFLHTLYSPRAAAGGYEQAVGG